MSSATENHQNEASPENKLDTLANEIVEIAVDFYQPLDASAVRLWIEQFELDEITMAHILQEVKCALSKFYISKKNMCEYFSRCLEALADFKTTGVVMNEKHAAGVSQCVIVDDILAGKTDDFNAQNPSHFILGSDWKYNFTRIESKGKIFGLRTRGGFYFSYKSLR
jgi:hypothetical protein